MLTQKHTRTWVKSEIYDNIWNCLLYCLSSSLSDIACLQKCNITLFVGEKVIRKFCKQVCRIVQRFVGVSRKFDVKLKLTLERLILLLLTQLCDACEPLLGGEGADDGGTGGGRGGRRKSRAGKNICDEACQALCHNPKSKNRIPKRFFTTEEIKYLRQWRHMRTWVTTVTVCQGQWRQANRKCLYLLPASTAQLRKTSSARWRHALILQNRADAEPVPRLCSTEAGVCVRSESWKKQQNQ